MSCRDARSLGRILHEVAARLETLRMQAANLEETVGSAVPGNSDMSGALIREMQSLDRVKQELFDLANVTEVLAESTGAILVPEDHIEAILKAVKLTNTRAFVAPNATPEQPVKEQYPSADLHLF